MARKRLPPHDPREWLNRARSNLIRAQHVRPDVYLEDLCFDAQQAAEKAIKSVFIHRGQSFPYIHDLANLLKRLQKTGVKIPKYVRTAHDLTPFAVEPRYPGLAGPVTRREHRRLVRIADAIVRWATRLVEKPTP